MYKIILEKRVLKFIEKTPKKHQEQIKKYILGFQENPNPHDSKNIQTYDPYRRGDSGEYRIVYRVDEVDKKIFVILVGKRNGGEVYRVLKNQI
jgi:mRNA interferase RelE/StbE